MKATHLICTGYGATAAAGALLGLARQCRVLWVAPHDGAGLVPRLAWESGLVRVIKACAPWATPWAVPPRGTPLVPCAFEGDLAGEIPGLRSDAPRVVVAVGRREWAWAGRVSSQLARAALDWTRAHRQVQWVFLSNLNMSLEGPIRALDPKPENLFLVPPLPYPVWRGLLEGAAGVLTDSALIADEALGLNLGVAALGETLPQDPAAVDPRVRSITPGDLDSPQLAEAMGQWLARPAQAAPAQPAAPDRDDPIRNAVEAWLAEA